MPRPAKWQHPTTAIRVPEPYADELLRQAKEWESEGFVQNLLVEEMVDRAVALCEEAGVDPKVLLLHMRLKDTIDFLSHYTPQQRKEFVVRLMDEVFWE